MTPKPLYEPLAGALCLDFVNTVDRPDPRPDEERLNGYPDLVHWAREAALLPQAEALLSRAGADPETAAAVFERALELREALFRLFLARARSAPLPPAYLEHLNAEVRAALARSRVRPSADGESFAWSWDEDPACLDAPLWPIARDAAELLTSKDLELVKECAADGCVWVFVDHTRNHRRRWCDMKVCGNRAKVREHRKRKRVKDGAD